MNQVEQYVAESLFSLTGTSDERVLSGLRQSMQDFLRELEEEWARFPDEKRRSTWNLVVNESNSTGLYLLIVLAPDCAVLQMGIGPSHDLVTYGEQRDFTEINSIPSELSVQFTSCAPRNVASSEFIDWVR